MSEIHTIKRPIYMDHNATTPVDPRVLETMLPFFSEAFGNAASTDHLYGAEASQAVNQARDQVAQLIGADADEIIFTSGATEANNLAIIGAAQGLEFKGRHIITCVTEHHAVLDVCEYLKGIGWDVTYLPVDHYGLVDPEAVSGAIRSDTVLISIMTANNEIGTIAPVAEIGQIARERDVMFHTDATQAVGYIPVNAAEMGIDLLSMSAHKMYGPKGIGALYVRKRRPRIRIVEQMHGGGHERGMRSGTLNVPAIVGFGRAACVALSDGPADSVRLKQLRDSLWRGISSGLANVERNGHPVMCLPHTLSIAIDSVASRSMLVLVKNSVAISSGSACTTSTVEPSHVILSLGYGQLRAHSTLRFGLGRGTTCEDVECVVEMIRSSVGRLRSLNSELHVYTSTSE